MGSSEGKLDTSRPPILSSAVATEAQPLSKAIHPPKTSTIRTMMNNTSLIRQPRTGNPLLGRSGGEWVHTSSASWCTRVRSAMSVSKSASDGVVGISSELPPLTGDRLGRAGRRPTPPDLGGRDSTGGVSGAAPAGVERAGISGSLLGASPNFAPHL